MDYLLREEIDREVRAAAVEFADHGDEEQPAQEAGLDQQWVKVREEHQRLFSERREVEWEKSQSGLFLLPLHDDGADSDASPREKLETVLPDSRKRQHRRTWWPAGQRDQPYVESQLMIDGLAPGDA
ncbi:hypothetical protein [Streptomyces sp. NPDC045251]|uniref:hypothetical protein n=1 Tax=unclassified Streptomyces TaxID=2593676 RepID=UPI0033E452D7